MLLLIFSSSELIFGMEGSFSAYISELRDLFLRNISINSTVGSRQEELLDIKVEVPEGFFFKQATLYEETVKDKKYIFRLNGISTILATPVERSLRPKGSILFEACLKERERFTRFCVSPDNSKMLAIVSKMIANQEVDQPKMVCFGLEEKEKYISFDTFPDIKKIFIRVDSEKLNDFLKQGYSQWYQHFDMQNDQVFYGLLNTFDKMAIDNSGTKFVMSNNNSVYCFDLSKMESKHICDLPTEPKYGKWPKIVACLGFNAEGDKVMIKYKNNCEEILSLGSHD